MLGMLLLLRPRCNFRWTASIIPFLTLPMTFQLCRDRSRLPTRLATAVHLHMQVAGQGRGLVAARDLEYGETIFSEQPYLCIPALSKRKQLCCHCLKVLPNSQMRQDPNQPRPVYRTRSGTFCSQSCLAAAQGSYYALESQVDMTRLHQYCEAHGERFPLLAARWGCWTAAAGAHCLHAQPQRHTSCWLSFYDGVWELR